MNYEKRFNELVKGERVEKLFNSKRSVMNLWGLSPYKHKLSKGELLRLKFFFISGALAYSKEQQFKGKGVREP